MDDVSRRRLLWPAVITATVLTAAAAGCGSTHPAGQPSASAVPPTTPPSSAAPAPTTPDSPPSPPAAVHAIGTRVATSDATVDATLLAYRQPVASSAPKPEMPGYEWGAAQVRVCARSETIDVSSLPWTLVYADGSVAEPSNVTYQQFPLPAYSITGRTLTRGRCASGWVTYPVPARTRPSTVQYHPDGEPAPIEWRAS